MLFSNESRQGFKNLGRNLPAVSFSNRLGFGIGFYACFSGCLRDLCETHKPILLISEKPPIFTSG